MNKLSMFFSFILVAITGTINAQQSADQLVKTTVDKIKKHKNVEISFDYQMLNNDANINETQSGKGYMQGESYKLILSGQEIISNGETVWTYLPENEEVMVSDVSQNEMGMNPLKLLTTYDKDYKSKYLPSNDKNIKLVEMYNSKGDFKKIVLKINEKNSALKGLVYSMKTGTNLSLPSKKFISTKIIRQITFRLTPTSILRPKSLT
jgi:Outer membrane lipoprotein carrier protein LolA.